MGVVLIVAGVTTWVSNLGTVVRVGGFVCGHIIRWITWVWVRLWVLRVIMALILIMTVIMMRRQVASSLSITMVTWIYRTFKSGQVSKLCFRFELLFQLTAAFERTISTQLAIFIVSMMGMRLWSRIAVVIMKTMIATVAIVTISMLLAGHLFVVSIVFLVSITAIPWVIARAMAWTMRVVTISIWIVLSMSRMSFVTLIGPGLVAVLIVKSVVTWKR